MTKPDKVSLFEMAEMIGLEAEGSRQRANAAPLLEPRARIYEAAHLTLALMALDEAAARKAIQQIVASNPREARLLIGMLMHVPPKADDEAKAA